MTSPRAARSITSLSNGETGARPHEAVGDPSPIRSNISRNSFLDLSIWRRHDAESNFREPQYQSDRDLREPQGEPHLQEPVRPKFGE